MLDYNQLIGFNGVSPDESEFFKTTWTTTVINTEIEIGFGTSNEYAFIDWGDGSTEVTRASGAAVTHTYSAIGTYDVLINGAIHISAAHSANNDMKSSICVDISQMGTGVSYRSLHRMFLNVTGNIFTFTDTPDLSRCTSMYETFKGASNFNQSINSWNISTITTMYGTFQDALVYNQPMNLLDTSNVQTFQFTFSNADAFNQDVSNFSLVSCTTVYAMFYLCAAFNNGGVPLTWSDTQNVAIWQSLFYNALAYNQALPNLDTSGGTNFTQMFRDCPFNQSVAHFDTTLATTMLNMFWGNTAFNQDLSAFDIDGTNLQGMLSGATAYNNGGAALTWTGKPTNMQSTFYGTTAFNQDISATDVTNVTIATSMFGGTYGFSDTNYNLMWIAWDALTTLQTAVDFDAPSNAATGTGLTARNNIVTNYSWTITDIS